MSSPITPQIDAIRAEAGVATADGVQSLLLMIQANDTDRVRDIRGSKDRLEPKVFNCANTTATNDLNIQGASVVVSTGASGYDLSGFVAPSTGKARLVIFFVMGAGTVTLKQKATSASANQLALMTGADTTIAQNHGAGFVYLSAKWRQVF